MMRKGWVCLSAALLVASCGVEEPRSRRPLFNNDENQTESETGQEADENTSAKKICYVTCFDYPKEYDWRTDPKRGSVKCSLNVFADGALIMKLPVGDEYEVSPDPDMHRMIAGHLYTDYCTGSETVIKKDGKTILRYPECEIICGIIVDKDTIYTLGHYRYRKGFAFRKNGEIILERSVGRTFGRLHRDGGRVCFAFAEQTTAEGRIHERYYHYASGNIKELASGNDVTKVWDIMSYNGEICYIATYADIERPVIFRNGQIEEMVMPEAADPVSFRMMAGERRIFWEGLFSSPKISVATALWVGPWQCIPFKEGMVANSCFVSEDGICCAFNPSQSNGLIYRRGEEFTMPEGYTVIGSSCGAVAEGILYIGLSSQKGESPKVWSNGELKELNNIYGYIASVSAF